MWFGNRIMLPLLKHLNMENALDCALWDLEAKRAQRPAHELAGLFWPVLRS